MFYSFSKYFFGSYKKSVNSNLPKSRIKKLFEIRKSGNKAIRFIHKYPVYKGEQMNPELKVEFDKQINYNFPS